MDLGSELPYWTLQNGLLGVYPPIREDISCDVVIVGGGITGALLAYHFIEDPYRFCHNVLQYCVAKGLRAFDRTAINPGVP